MSGSASRPHAGETFRQIRGGEVTYEVRSGAVWPDRTERALARFQFEQAFDHVPLDVVAKIVERKLDVGRGESWNYLDDLPSGDRASAPFPDRQSIVPHDLWDEQTDRRAR